MAQIDAITKRKPLTGNNRSKALNKTRRKWNLNLQVANVEIAPKVIKKVRITAKTMRTLKRDGKIV